MSLLLEQRRKKRRTPPNSLNAPRARRKKSHYTLDAPLPAGHPDRVLTFLEWCRLNRISERTGRRILAGDNGPVVTQMSPKRIGITVGSNATWQAARARG